MNEAIKKLKVKPELILVDGNHFITKLKIPFKCMVKGDNKYTSIAAASILAKTMLEALENVNRCKRCRMLTSNEYCKVCADTSRDSDSVCVVESPSDVLAIESTGGFRGKYFVLLGRLSPIEGVSPEDLGIDNFLNLIKTEQVKEVILATSSTVEGDATAMFIKDHIENIKVSRISYGIPIGGELEYVDGNTIARAIQGRTVVNVD